MKPASLVTVIIGLSLIAVAIYFRWSPRESQRHGPTSLSTAAKMDVGTWQGEPLPEEEMKLAHRPKLEDPIGVADQAREAVLREGESGQILGSDGRAIAGAWVGLSRAWLPLQGSQPDWDAVDWEWMLSQVSESITDSQGNYVLRDWGRSDDSLADPWLFLASPNHDLSYGALHDLESRPSVLVSASPRVVEVRDDSGQPVAGALVRWIVAADFSESNGAGQPPHNRWPACARAMTSDSGGRVLLPPCTGQVRLDAILGDLSSDVWIGAGSTALVTLSFGAQFSAHGIISGLDLPQMGMTVEVHVDYGNGVRQLKSVSVASDRSWQIDGIPCIEGKNFIFRLESEAGVPVEQIFRAPVPGSNLAVGLEWKRGVANRVHVLNAAGEPIADASVAIEWRSAERIQRIAQRTDPEGFANFANSPLGEVRFVGRADGYAAQRTLPFDSPLSDTFEFVLHEGGAVEGVCHMSGAPVEDFSVHYFSTDPGRLIDQEFHGRKDGSFLIEDATVGGLTLFASSASIPMGEPASVVVEAGKRARIELELLPPGEAFGQAVDALTGEGLAGATAQVFMAHAGIPLEPWGPSIPADSRGNFLAIPISRVAGCIRISAPGYASRTVQRLPGMDGRLDMEVVGLLRPRNLTLLLDAPPEVDCSQFALEAQLAFHLPRTRFASDCVLHFDSVEPGTVVWSVYPPGRQARIDTITALQTFRGEEIVLPLRADRSLTVKIVPVEGTKLPAELILSCAYLSPQSLMTRHNIVFGGEDTLTLDSITSDEVVVDINAPGERRFAVRSVVCPRAEHTFVEIPIGTPGRFLRFVDSKRSPLAAAAVSIALPADPTGWSYGDITDANGLIRLQGVEADELRLTVDLPEGRASGLSARLTGDPTQVVEIVVEIQGRFRVLLVERDQPLPRLRLAQMGLSQPTLVLADIEADERGLARQPGCKAGEYLVQVISDGYWSPRLRLRAGTDDPQYDLQVRSIGALFVNATRQGNPLAGVELELVATDFGESVHNWLKDGSLMLGIEALVTDQQGRLALDGLPNGHYRWQARAPDGLRLAGELTLAPFAEVALPIQFP